jgi:peptide deformylase
MYYTSIDTGDQMSTFLPILIWPNELLHQKSVDVVDFSEMEQLGDNLIATMKAKNGIGLAAPQVGILKNVIAIHVPNTEPIVLINPTIRSSSTTPFTVNEGCLSVPGFYEDRVRSEMIIVDYQNFREEHIIHAQFNGLQAFCIQHEMDHLQGKLFIDDFSLLKKDMVKRKIKKVQR